MMDLVHVFFHIHAAAAAAATTFNSRTSHSLERRSRGRSRRATRSTSHLSTFVGRERGEELCPPTAPSVASPSACVIVSIKRDPCVRPFAVS
uniref:Putative secreted protein n=1 Tax=Anopheles marajoara TaxID=58244 RepID=A0A2M4C9N6_9DIPT